MSLLTTDERKVILFLSGILLLGIGINFLAKHYTPIKQMVCAPPDLAKIDLNSANKEKLCVIPGIGEKLAMRIIEYRRKQGGFSETEELIQVDGIGDGKYEKLAEWVFCK